MEKTKFELTIDSQHFISLTVNDFDTRNVYGSEHFNVSVEMTKYEDNTYIVWVKVNNDLITCIRDVKSYNICKLK